jgi:hypothetical protein
MDYLADLQKTFLTESFSGAVDAIRDLPAKELIRLARAFTGRRVTSKAWALHAIQDRQDSVLAAGERVLAYGGRTAA